MFGGKRTRKNKGKKMRGGAVEPSFGGALGTAGPLWGGVSTATPYSSSTGGAIPDPYSTKQSGGRRTRKRKAGTKRRRTTTKEERARARSEKLMAQLASYTRKGGRKVMKGGAAQYLPRGAVGGFVGTGSRGMADTVDVSGSAPRANDVVPLRG